MKRKLYDFSTANAVIVLLAYGVVFLITIYSLIKNQWTSVSGIVFLAILASSLVFLLVYYVFFALTIFDDRVKLRSKTIAKQNLQLMIRPNFRYRYNEIIFRDKNIPYETMTRKEMLRNEIAIQYFPKYEQFLLENLQIKKIKMWGVTEDE